jgi:hypothetical protein
VPIPTQLLTEFHLDPKTFRVYHLLCRAPFAVWFAVYVHLRDKGCHLGLSPSISKHLNRKVLCSTSLSVSDYCMLVFSLGDKWIWIAKEPLQILPIAITYIISLNYGFKRTSPSSLDSFLYVYADVWKHKNTATINLASSLHLAWADLQAFYLILKTR